MHLARILALLAILMASVALLPSAALADAVTLRMATWLPSHVMPYPMLQAWADEIHQASEGTLTVAIDPQPTVPSTQQYDLVKQGEADLAFILPTHHAVRSTRRKATMALAMLD